MGALRQRLESHRQATIRGEFQEALWEEVTVNAERIDTFLEQDTGRDPDTLLERYVDLTEQGFAKAADHVTNTVLENYYRLEEFKESVEDTGLTPAETLNRTWVDEVEENLDDLLRYVDNPDIRYVLENVSDQWLEGMQTDLENNFLYVEWGVQLVESKTPCRTYAAYCLGISALALNRLITHNPEGYKLLCTLYEPELSAYDMGQIMRWYHTEYGHLSNQPQRYYSEMVSNLPWTHEAIEAILRTYANVVRLSRERHRKDIQLNNLKNRVMDSPLPDDLEPYPEEFMVSFEDLRLDQAVAEYELSGDSAKTVADKYGIPQKRFATTLRKRGVMRTPGGYRKKKKGTDEQLQQAIQDYRHGYSIVDAAERNDVGRPDLTAALHERNLVRSPAPPPNGRFV